MKHQFSTLDGLRGVAAVSVMLYHRRDWFGGSAFFGHAFLAVDFFFLLSGFVIAHAYGDRLAKRGAATAFLRERLIRLHPMLLVGAVVALTVGLLDARAGRVVGMGHPVLTFLAHVVPYPAVWENADAAFPWNMPIWSLFWELIANILFALLAPFLSDRRLIAIVGTSAFVMLIVSALHNGFQVGFARDQSQFLLGFPRVCASFFLGVLIRRRFQSFEVRSKLLGIVCAAILVGTFMAIPAGASASAIYDPLIAFGLYPLLVIAAAQAPSLDVRITSGLGALSYPLYVIHEPMLRIVGGVLVVAGLSDGHPDTFEAVARLCLVPLIAFVILKLYDEPVRAKLRRRFSGKANG